MDSYVRPNILTLNDISLTGNTWETPEECAERKFLADVDTELHHTGEYDKIRRSFTSLDDWPDSTNIKCWACNHSFDNRPVFVPTYIKETDDGLEIGVKGNMCGFNCAERWIIDRYAHCREDRWKYQDNLILLHYLFTGYYVASIAPAPSITEHQMYGGDLDHNAFWRKMKELEIKPSLPDPLSTRLSNILSMVRPTVEKIVFARNAATSNPAASAVSAVVSNPVNNSASSAASTAHSSAVSDEASDDIDDILREFGITE
jgi:hypothetical protein